MHNLIDSTEKLLLTQEYHRRRLVTTSIFIMAVVLVALSLLLLIWAVMEIRLASVEKLLSVEEKLAAGSDRGQIAAEADAAAQALAAIKPFLKVTPVSAEFERILAKRPSQVYVKKLYYVEDNLGVRKVVVSGTAGNRKALVAFIDSLKTEAGFKQVESPLSNVIKDGDSPFTITIVMTSPKKT